MTVSTVLARVGGLYAEYFNNAFLSGIPTLTKIDNEISFNWNYGLITPEAGNFVSAHWYGKLLAPTSEDFTFLLQGDFGFRFFMDGNLLIDRWNNCCDDMTVTTPLIKGVFYDIVL